MFRSTVEKSRDHRRFGVAVLALLSGLSVACSPSTATQTDPGRPEVRAALEKLVEEGGFPGAMASVRGLDGKTHDYTAGVGDVKTDEPVPANGGFRIASNTKMFTATVVLQLVDEGKLDLDAPVERYLPGLVRGEGIAGDEITIRQLLQHTSGLPDYDDELATDLPSMQHQHYEPRELVDVALARGSLFEPGTEFAYSNTNYVLAGLVVQRVTGRPVSEEITTRVIDEIGLRDTYWPALGDQTIRGEHPHGYVPAGDGELIDFSVSDTSMGWAAGHLVGTPRDVNTFLTSLLDGELLSPDMLEEMKKTVDAPNFDLTGESTYGLGLATFKLSCGGSAWTHGGDAPGYVSRVGVTDDGRAATVVVTSNPTSLDAARDIEKALDTALCGRGAG